MGIEYSLFNKTHCDTHFKVTQEIFLDLKSKGYIYTKETNQYYCPKCARFLPDRYVEGVCPKCGAEKTRSDQCDACGTTFEPGDLLKPYCTLCDSTPEIRPTEHFFLKLSAFRDDLIKFVSEKDYWRSNVKAFTKNWLEDGLYDRAITRDMAWEFPSHRGWGQGHLRLVEAVIGYLSHPSSIPSDREARLLEGVLDGPEVGTTSYNSERHSFHSIIWARHPHGYRQLDLAIRHPCPSTSMIGRRESYKSRRRAIDCPSVLQK